MTIPTFFILQLDRLTPRPQTHAPGPKRPSLSELDNGKKAAD